MSQQGINEALLAYLAIMGSMLVSYARARAEGLSIPCKGGFFTRVERCIVLIVALFFGWAVPALWVLAIGTNLTALQRILHVYGQTKGQAL
jgi:CDP-diacylglycerol--glycerol-3-phosphate 3-phosphatidyltransferase